PSTPSYERRRDFCGSPLAHGRRPMGHARALVDTLRGVGNLPINRRPASAMRGGDSIMIQDVAAAATSLPEHCRSRFGFLRAAWLALALLGLIASRPAHADTQIQSAAGTCVSATGTGTIAWSNPSRAQTSDNSYATAALTGNNIASNFLKCT